MGKFGANGTTSIVTNQFPQRNTRVDVIKLDISFAPRCQWIPGNLPVRSTCKTGTKCHCIENINFRNIKI